MDYPDSARQDAVKDFEIQDEETTNNMIADWDDRVDFQIAIEHHDFIQGVKL
jgi:hypothetical protein